MLRLLPQSQVQAEKPSDTFKISSSSTLAVIVHICIDGLAGISIGWYAEYVVWEILTSQLTLSLSVSPPVPPSLSLPPPFISHLQFSADLPPSLKSLWISENIPRSAAADELILALCCCIRGQVSMWDTHSLTRTLSLGIWQIYKILHLNTKKGLLNNKEAPFPLWAWRFRWENLCFLQQRRQRDVISVTTNWESTCLVLFVQTLVTHGPEYLQRSDVRQSKQDRAFRLIRVLIVIDLLSFLQTAGSGVFLSFHSETASILWLFWFSRSYLIIFSRQRFALWLVCM